jgi:hypothetical protein
MMDEMVGIQLSLLPTGKTKLLELYSSATLCFMDWTNLASHSKWIAYTSCHCATELSFSLLLGDVLALIALQ